MSPALALVADVIPPPTRPGWDEHPAPLPLPPEALALVVALALVALAAALARRQAAR